MGGLIGSRTLVERGGGRQALRSAPALGRPWIQGIWVALVLAGAACRGAGALRDDRGAPPPRGILLLLADDHGVADAGAYGSTSVRTPALDGLAAGGLRFERAQVATAICQPSRATILTGLDPAAHGVSGFYPLRDGVRPLPLLLREAGWFTGLVGKRHLQPLEAYGLAWTHPVERSDRGPAPLRQGVRAFFAAHAERGGDEPFFLLVAAHDPHRPLPGEAGAAPVPSPIDPASVELPAWLPDLPETRTDFARYLDAVGRLDATVGAVLDELSVTPFEDDTLVLYTSDHGPPMPFAKTTGYDAGLRVPLLARWPAAIEAGGVRDALVSAQDLTPTLLDLAGLEGERAELESQPAAGRSFARLVRADSDDANLGANLTGDAHRKILFATQTDHLRLPSRPLRTATDGRWRYVLNFFTDRPLTIEAVRTPAWRGMQRAAEQDPALASRLVRFANRPTEELYDLEADPFERTNLLASPNLAAEPTAALTRLRDAITDRMRRLEDPMLHVTPWATPADREATRAAYESWQDLQARREEYEGSLSR